MPTELDEQRRKIMQLEIEESALKKETDNLQSKERLADLQKELAEMRDTFNTQKAQWDNEKHSVERSSRSYVSRSRISINRSRKQNRTTIWKKQQSCSMVNFQNFSNSWS